MARIVEAPVEGANLVDVHRVHVGNPLVEAARVANIVARIGVAVQRDRVLGHAFRLFALLFDSRQGLPPPLVQGLGRKRRMAQQIAGQGYSLGQVLAARLHVQADAPGLALHVQGRLQLVESVLHLLARQRRRTFVEQRGHRLGNLHLARQRRGIAEMKRQHGVRRAPTCALGKQRSLDVVNLESLGARVDVCRRGIESFRLRRRSLRFEVEQGRDDIGFRRRRRAQRLVGGKIVPQRAIARQQALLGDTLHVGQAGGTHTIANQEKQAPVALGNRLGERHAHCLRVRERLFPALQPFAAGALQFVSGDRLARQRFERGEQLHACRLGVLPGRQLRTEYREARVGQALHEAIGVGGEALLDLPYAEDSRAEVDMNVVQLGSGRLVEVQGTGESGTFDRKLLDRMLDLAEQGIGELARIQARVLGA